MKQLSFNNNPALKAIHVEQAERHAAQDMLVAGTYGEGEGAAFRGCSVGCFAHDIDPSSFDHHEVVAAARGLPEWLVVGHVKGSAPATAAPTRSLTGRWAGAAAAGCMWNARGAPPDAANASTTRAVCARCWRNWNRRDSAKRSPNTWPILPAVCGLTHPSGGSRVRP